MHDVQSLQRRDGGDEQRRDDGEILGHVVGDREGGQRAARHQELLADLDDLDQFRGVIVQVDHVAGLLGGLRTAVHRHAHVGLRQRRGIVRAVAHHGDQFTGPLLPADVFEFILGAGFGDEVVDACLFGNVFCRQRVVARHHHGFHAHLAQTLETLADTRLDDVLQFDHTPDPLVLADDERRPAVLGDTAHGGFDTCGAFVPRLGTHAQDRFRSALADTAAVGHVHTRALGLGGELHHVHADQLQGIGLDALLGTQFDDGLAFGRRIGHRREDAQPDKLPGTEPVDRIEARGLAVTDGDRTGLVDTDRRRFDVLRHRCTNRVGH